MRFSTKVKSFLQDASDRTAPSFVKPLQNFIRLLRSGLADNSLMSNGSSSLLAEINLDQICSARCTRSDPTFWIPVAVVAFQTRESRWVLHVAASPRSGYVSLFNGRETQFIYNQLDSKLEDIIITQVPRILEYFDANNWSNEAFANVGNRVVFAARDVRVHDSLCQIAGLKLSEQSWHPDAWYTQSSMIDVVRSCGVPQEASLPRMGRAEQDEERLSPVTSWVECPIKFDVTTYAEIGRMLHRMSSNIDDGRSKVDDVFRVFISYEAEKRGWVEQEQAIIQLLKALKSQRPNIEVCVNGMTDAPMNRGKTAVRYASVKEREEELIQRLVRAVPDIRVTHLFGYTVEEKAVVLKSVDFFIAPVISAAMLPMLMDVPGVSYGVKDMIETVYTSSILKVTKETIIIDPSHVQVVSAQLGLVNHASSKGGAQCDSYSIRPDVFMAACAQVLARQGLMIDAFT